MGGGEKFAPQLRDTLTREIRPAVAGSRMGGRFWVGPPSLLTSRTRGLRDKGIKGLRKKGGRFKAGGGRRRRVETISNDVPTGHE